MNLERGVMGTIARLRGSTASRWREELLLGTLKERGHWQTKVHHYRAFRSLAEAGHVTTKESVVEAADSAMSTLYTVAGPSARHSLLSRFERSHPQLAGCYPQSWATSRLAHETVMWRFWPHRETWLRRLEGARRDRTAAAERLILVLADFAGTNGGLMRAAELTPPICAVEDLLVLLEGRITPPEAFALLRRVVATAAGGLHVSPEVVLGEIQRELSERVAALEEAPRPLPTLAEAVAGVLADPHLDGDELLAAVDLLRVAGEALCDPSEPPGSPAP
ncbi:hypothetical protein [Streptosporangium sp. NPDC051022]|uniref:hypothetical protein n=1 Tax=Streptosporangium sp. NPDC051022 TaxID=3155752 RepID=UPI003445B0BB